MSSKIILLISDPKSNNDVLAERIKIFGNYYSFWGNHWLIETNDTPESVYNKLTLDGTEKRSILVSAFDMTKKDGYWGRMNSSLWDWVKIIREK